jgi:riboflavin kinase / FMN adenylyltransferase
LGVEYVFTLPAERQAAVIAISSFDGVHRGHQRMLAETVALASRRGATPIALLPWPAIPEDATANSILTTLGERIARIERFVPDVRVVVLAADASQPWSPETLIQRIIAGWDAASIVVAPSAAEELCGTELAEAARLTGVSVTSIPDETEMAAPIGEQIRDAVSEGRVAEAASLLTYNYTLEAEVVGGDRRGRLLGFPTANLRVDAGKVIPSNGIYAVLVGLPGERDTVRPAVASVGVRPTFGDGNARLVEVHLLDLSMDLYGVRITTEFVEWLRSEERFATVEALIEQMRADVAQARGHLVRYASSRLEQSGSHGRFHQDDAHP